MHNNDEPQRLGIFTVPHNSLPEPLTFQSLLDIAMNTKVSSPGQGSVDSIASCLKHPDVPYLLIVYINQYDKQGNCRQINDLQIHEPMTLTSIALSERNEPMTVLGPYHDVIPEEHDQFLEQVRSLYYCLPGLHVRRDENRVMPGYTPVTQ